MHPMKGVDAADGIVRWPESNPCGTPPTYRTPSVFRPRLLNFSVTGLLPSIDKVSLKRERKENTSYHTKHSMPYANQNGELTLRSWSRPLSNILI